MINNGGFKGGGGYAYVRERLGIVSVKDFGAAGNGVTDDTAAIQAALDSGAADVYLPPGTYSTSQTLTVNGNTRFHGQSSARSGINYSGAGSAILVAEGVHNVVVCDVSVSYTGTPTSGGAIEIADDVVIVRVDNVYTYGGYNGIQVGFQCNTVYIQNVYVTGTYAGLYCQSGADVANSVFRGSQVALQLDSTSGAFNCDQSAFYGPLGMWTTNSKNIATAINEGIWMWNCQFNLESGTSPSGTSQNVYLQYWGGDVHFFGCWATGAVLGLQTGEAVYGTPFLEVVGGSWSGFEFSYVGNPDNTQGVVLNGVNIEGPGNGTAISIANNTEWFIVKGCIIRDFTNGIVIPSLAGAVNGPYIFSDNIFTSVGTILSVGQSQFYGTATFRNNAGYNPIGVITPPASPLASGTTYQNLSMVPITLYQPAYATTSGTAGSVAVALGSSSSPSTLYTDLIDAGTSSSVPRVLTLRVPPGWYYSFTATGATLADAMILGE